MNQKGALLHVMGWLFFKFRNIWGRDINSKLKAFTYGFIGLVIGIAVYLFVRDPRILYLNNFLDIPFISINQADNITFFMNVYTGSIPTAVHAFAFSIFTALALGTNRKNIVLASIVWAVIDIFFEILQTIKDCSFILGKHILGDFLCAYISSGTFDWLDIASIILGSFFAYYLMCNLCVHNGESINNG